MQFFMYLLIVFFWLFFSVEPVNAQSDTTTVGMYDLTLVELSKIKVTSATKSTLSIQKAPSIVRVFTQSDIISYGFHTMKDLLDQVPGIQIQEYRAGHKLIWVRGVQARYNNKVLLLIDGVPYRDSFYGNFKIDEMVPLEYIDKVEIITGPGSVLYGANGFSGVISITTKTKGKNIKSEYGSFNTYENNVQYDYKGLYGNFNYIHSDGFSPDLNFDGLVRKHDQSVDGKIGFLKYSNKSLTAIASFTDFNYPYKYDKATRQIITKRAPIYGAVNYKFNFEDKGVLNFRGYYNYYRFEVDVTRYQSETSNTIRRTLLTPLTSYMYGSELEYSLEKKRHHFILGMAFQAEKGIDLFVKVTSEDGLPVNIKEDIIKKDLNGTASRSNYGVYLQDVWELNKVFSLTVGVRGDVLANFDNQLSYRVGLTGMFTDNLYGKLLHGTAYRVPSFRETVDVVSYNDNLQPEHLNTSEAQIGYVFDKADINLTFFNNHFSKFIQEVVVDSILDNGSIRVIDDEMAFNFDSRDITGLELSVVTKPIKGMLINIGFSYILRAEETMGAIDSAVVIVSSPVPEGKENLVFLSKTTINLAASYFFAKRIRVGVSANHFSNRNTPEDYQADVPMSVQDNSLANGFLMLNSFANIKISKKVSFNFNAYNLTNSRIYSPPFGNPRGYDLQKEEFRCKLGINYRF